METEVLWSFETGSEIPGCPGIAQSSNGPIVVLGTNDGRVIALDGTGAEVWSDTPGGIVQGWPATVSLDGASAILVGDNLGRLHAYSADGNVLWRVGLGELEQPELFRSGISPWSGVAELRGFDEACVVVSDRGGNLSALAGDGHLVWRAHLDDDGIGVPAVGDIDGDGRDEIVVGCIGGRIHCLSADGDWRWSADAMRAEAGYHRPLMVDWSAGPHVIAVGDDYCSMRCMDGSGKEVWRHVSRGAISSQAGATPLVVVGECRFFIANSQTGQQIVSAAGEELWYGAYAGGNQPFGPSVADVDGDGSPELLMIRRGCNTLWILGADGEAKATVDLGGSMSGAPVVADLDDDGGPEFVVVDQATGVVRAMRVRDAEPGGAISWPTSRGPFDGRCSVLRDDPVGTVASERGPAVTGAPLARELPVSLRTGGQGIKYALAADEADATIFTETTGPDSVRHVFVRCAGDEQHGWIDAIDRGSYRLRGEMHTVDGNVSRVSDETIDFEPYAAERERGRDLLDRLRSLADERAESSAPSEADRQVARAEHEWDRLLALADLGEAVPHLLQDVNGHLAAIERLLSLRRHTHERLPGGDAEMVVWVQPHPWTPFDPLTDAPDESQSDSISVRTERRSHEASVVSVANATDGPLTVRAWLGPWEGGSELPGPGSVELRRRVFVPTARGNMTADSLPRLDEAGLLTIPTGESVRLWIDWSAGDLPAGAYTTTLHLRAVTVSAQAWEVPVSWEVLPVALPERSPLWFHVWAYDGRTVFPDEDAVFEDLADHHVNVYDLPFPRVTYDSAGTTPEIDWTAADRVLRLAPEGSFFLWSGNENAASPEEGAPPVGSEEWRVAFDSLVGAWIGYLQSHGIGYDRHAIYIIDEPGIEGGRRVEFHDHNARLFRAADPEIRIFANPAGGATAEHIDRLFETTDIFDPIWQWPERYVHLDTILDRADTVWTYSCGDGAREQTRMQYYWAPMWTAASLGMTGLGFWSYAGRSVDFWQGETPQGCDWELVYTGDGTVVPSHRWQGVRIGIEDYARLWMLAAGADSADESGDGRGAKRLRDERQAIIDEAIASGLDEAVIAGARDRMRDMLLGLT